jgi:molecular chaperone DnaJ
MNTHEACQLLGIPVNSPMEDAKAAFKKLAIQYHPDRNKDPGAEDKFKEINTAFQFLEKYGTNPQNNINTGGFGFNIDFGDLNQRMAQMFHQNFVINHPGPPIVITISIPFEMSVLGGNKEITYNRLVKCANCIDGKTKVPCKKCNGTGKRKYGGDFNGGFKPADDRELPCNGCTATGSTTYGICKACNGSSKTQTSETFSIQIPPGVQNGNNLIMNGRGNYRIMDLYDALVIVINVEKDPDFILVGNDVISNVELSLLEALKGTKKSLRTIKGEKTLQFNPKIKNGDKIKVSGFGVPPNGHHVYEITVNYPEDVSELINVLEKDII